MEFAERIEVAPKNGDFILLLDTCSWELGRWAQEANGWVQLDGTPVRISPTHWTRVSGDAGGADGESLPFLVPPLPDKTAETQKRPLTRLILGFAAAVFCIGGSVFWIGSEDSSSDNSAAELERKFSQERAQGYVIVGRPTASRERENVSLTEAVESKRTLNSKQRDLMQTPDESEAGAEALAREPASARENAVEARNLTAAREREKAEQARDTKRIADPELKQSLDESEKSAFALAPDLTSAREPLASAGKPTNEEATARDAGSPTGPINRPIEGSNAASETTGSTTTPQGRGHVMAGAQASSEADDETASASGRLARLTRLHLGLSQQSVGMSSADEAKLIARAESLIKRFDFAGARLLLQLASDKGSARAAFIMAETYDWQILRPLQAYGVRGDDRLAREFYQLAAGIEKARERVEALQSGDADTHVGGEKRSR